MKINVAHSHLIRNLFLLFSVQKSWKIRSLIASLVIWYIKKLTHINNIWHLIMIFYPFKSHNTLKKSNWIFNIEVENEVTNKFCHHNEMTVELFLLFSICVPIDRIIFLFVFHYQIKFTLQSSFLIVSFDLLII